MQPDVNPFVYSRPLAPEEIIDRDQETEALLRHVIGGHFVRLFAPRKFGKTSLLRRALADGHAKHSLTPVLVDLYRVSSIADVTVRFERAYSRALKGSLRVKVEEFLQRTGIGLSLGAYGISAKLQMERRFDPLPALHALLDLPLTIDERGGHRAFIAIDEFQDVARIPDLDGLIRSHIQFHGDVASYVFAGSEPGMMKQLFEDRDRPLYGSAVPQRLLRLADEDIAAYVSQRFHETGRAVGEALNPLLAAALGHPQRAMLLAHRLWEEIDQGETGAIDHWNAAHTATLAELDAEFDARWRGLGSSEQKTMRAVIAGRGSPYRSDVISRLALTKSMIRRALPRLTATADIETADGAHVIVDPLFAEWIAGIETE